MVQKPGRTLSFGPATAALRGQQAIRRIPAGIGPTADSGSCRGNAAGTVGGRAGNKNVSPGRGSGPRSCGVVDRALSAFDHRHGQVGGTARRIRVSQIRSHTSTCWTFAPGLLAAISPYSHVRAEPGGNQTQQPSPDATP